MCARVVARLAVSIALRANGSARNRRSCQRQHAHFLGVLARMNARVCVISEALMSLESSQCLKHFGMLSPSHPYANS